MNPNILSEMVTWGRALGTDDLLLASNIQEAKNLLALSLRNKRMLLIIDNVWQVEDAIPFAVGGSDCAVLITTRLNDVAQNLAVRPENIYRLPVLTDENALDLMYHLAPLVVQEYPQETLMLVHQLEGLPLALQIAGRLLQSESGIGLGVKELFTEILEGSKLLQEKAPPDREDISNETTPSIAVLLQKSVDMLDKFTRDCYAYLGVFAPKPATFDLNAMAYVWGIEDPKPVVDTLVNRGLLEYLPEINRYEIHPILLQLAKSLLIDD
jgi:hypothetical protein